MRHKSKALAKTKPAKPTEEPLVRKNGRPLALADREQAKKILGGLGAIHASWRECATALDIGEATLWRLFHRWPDCKEAYEDGKNAGKMGLRRNQLDLSKKNATMAIFLGMNMLGQKDYRNVGMSGSVKVSHQHTIIGAMMKEIDEESRGKPVIEHRKDEGKAA